MSKFKVIDRVLTMSHTKYSARSLFKLMSSYLLRDGHIQDPVKNL